MPSQILGNLKLRQSKKKGVLMKKEPLEYDPVVHGYSVAT